MTTPLEQSEALARAAGVSALFLKREDLQPTGSFKYRSAMRQIEHMVESGKFEGVVSSSGNAAISLAKFAAGENVCLYVFVSPDILPQKLAAICAYRSVVIQSRKAMRLANYLAAHYRLRNLRPSVDDVAIVGFRPLGEEIAQQMKEHGGAQAIFSFATSGASILGMARGYLLEPRPSFVAVQKQPILRGEEVVREASILSVSEEEIEGARNLLSRESFSCAPEAMASFAGICKMKPENNVVWVVSGRDWEADPVPSSFACPIHRAETFEEVDVIYAQTSRG